MGCVACAASALEGSGITLTRKESSPIPIEADSISPDRFIGLGQSEIAALPAFYGRRQVTLGDLFEVDGAGADSIMVTGDLRSVKKIGHAMTMGQIALDGSVGPHTGAFMSGGEILVQGAAGDWLGAHMSGGLIVVQGDAGHFVGAGYSGETRGMRGGTIVVQGDAGREAGAHMRRGTLVVQGDTGEFAGSQMLAGSIFVAGRLGRRAGAGMKRGTIVGFGEAPELLPTFRYTCTYRPVFMQYYLRHLTEWGHLGENELDADVFRRYIGDLNSGGRGEVLLRDQSE